MVVNVFFSAVTQATMSRHELLAWVNDCLQAQLTKIEEMATGAAYCGLTDLLFPGSIPLKKVKWNSKNEVDSINNWNILQKSWKEIGIDKPVPVDRLLRAKFQENFEFLQWFKKFFDANWEDHEYDPLAVRNGEEFPAALPGGAKRPAPPRVSAPKPSQPPTRTAAQRKSNVAPAATKPVTSTRTSLSTKTTATKTTTSAPASNGTAVANAIAETEARFKQKLDQVTTENQELTEGLATVEKERDFYFAKLRAIEILCTELGEGKDIKVDKITQILYETEEGETYIEAGELNGATTPETQANNTLDIVNDKVDIEPIIDDPTNVKTENNGHTNDDILMQAAKIDLNDSETF